MPIIIIMDLPTGLFVATAVAATAGASLYMASDHLKTAETGNRRTLDQMVFYYNSARAAEAKYHEALNKRLKEIDAKLAPHYHPAAIDGAGGGRALSSAKEMVLAASSGGRRSSPRLISEGKELLAASAAPAAALAAPAAAGGRGGGEGEAEFQEAEGERPRSQI
jgi:hypothetical protein